MCDRKAMFIHIKSYVYVVVTAEDIGECTAHSLSRERDTITISRYKKLYTRSESIVAMQKLCEVNKITIVTILRTVRCTFK